MKSNKGYVAIQISYDLKLVFPVDEGMQFISQIHHAEEIKQDDESYKDKSIEPSKKEYKISFLSEDVYKVLKANSMIYTEDK